MTHDLSQEAILSKKISPVEPAEALGGAYQIVDVRSPGEFADGTMPGAANVPLFDEDERSIIGTIYRQGGHQQAVVKGYEFVQQKLADLLGAFTPYKNASLAIFCARGGMRSLSVVNLLRQQGYNAVQIHGGYKTYRNAVLAQLADFQPPLIVIHGLTGTGKTRILQHLDQAIDLEDLASHRSSLFGGLDRAPSNQKTFESRLSLVIDGLGPPPYFIEGESRKIGRVFIPQPLAKAMKEAVLVRVDCSLETRIQRIIEDYPISDGKILAQIDTILQSLNQKMGNDRVVKMRRLLETGNLVELVRILLLEYYDRRYAKSMREYRYALEISSENIAAAAARLTEFRQSMELFIDR